MDTHRMKICTIFMIFSGLSTIWAEKCELYPLSMPYNGMYCSSDGVVTPLVAPHRCRYLCILSSTCNAYNYNATIGTCTHFSSPCPQAFSDPAMEFVVLTQLPYEQCYEWIPFQTTDPIDKRMVHNDYASRDVYYAFRIIGRTQRSGNDVLCYFHKGDSYCHGYLGSQFATIQIQLLPIVEGCTIFWVPYTARDPVPPRAVKAGHMVNGDIVYVTKFSLVPPAKLLVGHYVAGAENTVSQHLGVVQRSTTMMMMVVL